jgi:hypothetical protein
MSFPTRRSAHVGKGRGITHRLTHWLTGALVAGSLTSSLSAKTLQHRPPSVSKTSYTTLLAAKSSRPYLAVAGPSPLRFAFPLPDFSPELALATPPEAPEPEVQPAPATESPAVASPNSVAAAGPERSTPSTSDSSQPITPPAPSGLPPVSILPDDLVQPATPEDFLPFFLPPRIPSAPTSRATYQQK